MRERQIKERTEREAAEGESLRGGRTRWMLKMREGIMKQRHHGQTRKEEQERKGVVDGRRMVGEEK